MPERPRHSRSRMPPPAFLPSLASELKRTNTKLKKNSGEDSSSAESLSTTRKPKPNASFAEKAKGLNDAGYCSAIADQESLSSSEVNNNDSSKSTTPQAKRKVKPKAKVEKKKNKRGFEISFAFEAATKDKEEAKPPQNIANSNAAVNHERPPTPESTSVPEAPEAWDEGIDTPSDEESSRYSTRTSSIASTSQIDCFACKPPFVPYSDPIWQYTPPHTATCHERCSPADDEEEEEYTEDLEVIARFNHRRNLNIQRRLMLRKELEKYICSDPWAKDPLSTWSKW